MSIYRPAIKYGRLGKILDIQKMDGQIIVDSESDYELLLTNGVFILEIVKAKDSETINIKDGDNNPVFTGLLSIDQEHSPIRLNNGIKISGNIDYLKGFVLNF
jgi:hypothetical protein